MPSPAAKKKEFVLDKRAAEAAAKLVAAEAVERFAVGCGSRKRFGAEIFEAGASERRWFRIW